ncbi:MAG: TraB/GumN family protein [Rhodanobacter sp.]
MFKVVRPLFCLLLLAASCLAETLLAQSSSPVSGAVTDMAPVLVSGAQPGPGLWKVSKNGHVLWVLGTVSPLPEHMQWKGGDVEKVVASSQQLLEPPGLEIGAHLGFFGKLLLLPSMIGLRNNPDGATLQQVLPPALYARWDSRRQEYLGDSHRFKRLRPIFAGKALYDVAMKRAGLTADGGVRGIVDVMAARHGVAAVGTSYRLILENPRAAAKTFKQSSMEDLECLSQIIDAIGSDMGQVAARANAWSTGDIETLQSTLASPQKDSCLSAISGARFARRLGMSDVQQRIDGAWLGAARKALKDNTQTFALLPMEQLLSADGYLARLHREGFAVQSPDEQQVGPASGQAGR